ncbi:hypothetical protein Tco_1148208 [Tanacetum coccineum]
MIACYLVPRTCYVRCQTTKWQAVTGQPSLRVRKRYSSDTSLLMLAGQQSTPRGIHVSPRSIHRDELHNVVVARLEPWTSWVRVKGATSYAGAYLHKYMHLLFI